MLTRLSGDCRNLLTGLPADSVHCCASSPPFWSQREYLPKGHELKHLEIGMERDPQLFIDNLMEVYDQVKRVLRDDGTCWVNLGDAYWDNSKWDKGKINGCPEGNLAGTPSMFALAMQARGWYWRDTIIWSKPNPLPSPVNGWRWEKHQIKIASAKRNVKASHASGNRTCPDGTSISGAEQPVWEDCPGCKKCSANGGLVLNKGSGRTTTAHEYLFLFSKSMTYFYDAYAVRRPASAGTIERNKYTRILEDPKEQFAVRHNHEFNGTTANLSSVWEISPEHLKDDHYAAWPSEIPSRCIKAGTSAKGCCAKCGDPIVRIVDDAGETKGWRPSCECNAGAVPATVLDPFGGSGRTGIAAVRLNRRAILCELNPDSIAVQDRQVANNIPLFAQISSAPSST